MSPKIHRMAQGSDMADAAIIQTETLDAIADAIIAKGGATGKLTPLEMPAAIESIKTKPDVLHRSDANFYDSDGTLLFAFTKEEVAELEELPVPPERELLAFDTWTHTLEDIKSAVVGHGVFVEVGAIYRTVDGATKIKIRLGEQDRRFVMRLFVPAGQRVVVRWSETSPLDTDVLDTTSAETTFTVRHDYTDTASTHVISVEGGEHYYTSLPVHNSLATPITGDKVEAIYFGGQSGVITYRPFLYHSFLKDLVLPQGFKYKTGTQDNRLLATTGLVDGCTVEHVNIPPGFAWESTNSLFTSPDGGLQNSVHVPTYTQPYHNSVQLPCRTPNHPFSRPAYVSLSPTVSMAQIPARAFAYAYNLREVQLGVLPAITGGNTFFQCTTLQRVSTTSTYSDRVGMTIPDNQSTSTFAGCYSLTEVPLINCETLPQSTFSMCESLPRVQLQNTTYIADNAFYGCSRLQEVDLIRCSSVVTVAATTFSAVNPGEFEDRTITVKVPALLVSNYETAIDTSSSEDTLGWKAAATTGNVTFVFQGV